MAAATKPSTKLLLHGIVLLLCLELPAAGKPVQNSGIRSTLSHDFKHYYSRHRLLRTGIAFGAGAIMANTSMDEDLQSRFQGHLRHSRTDDIASVVKPFGDGRILIPLSLVAASSGYIFQSGGTVSLLSRWGQHTARAYLLGGPALFLMQRVTGASRPDETEDGSRWKPFKDDNGVSGHAFIGAVPFLTMAHMSGENLPLKYLFYPLSMLPAWSRINDNRHYPSQALLGWYMAWEAAGAVFESDRKNPNVSISPLITSEICGLCIKMNW